MFNELAEKSKTVFKPFENIKALNLVCESRCDFDYSCKEKGLDASFELGCTCVYHVNCLMD